MAGVDINKIRFHYLISGVGLKNRTDLKKFLLHLFKRYKRKVGAINYIFCSDSYLIKLNQTYLAHNTYTDIITFELSEPTNPLIADLYISIERIKENAVAHNNPFYKELHRVIFHGALHLCGFNDKEEADTVLMRAKEDGCIYKYFVSHETGVSKY